MFESLWGFKKQPTTAQATPVVPPQAEEASADKCPVDHSTRAAWLAANPGQGSPFQPKAQAAEGFAQAASSTEQDSTSTSPQPPAGPVPAGKRVRRLSEDRVISSIPRYATENSEASGSGSKTPSPEPASSHTSTDAISEENKWVYPSEGQFFRAMLRKHQAGLYSDASAPPNPADMQTIVPIHNAVNEKAWAEVLAWEARQGGDKCGGIRLVSFKGRPKERTPKAWINVALGYTAPFDRHDWVINRCGEEIRYVIDFYSGRPPSSVQSGPNSPSAGNLSFYLDVRPALDGWEGARLRVSKLFGM